jgi:hypothetical protein
MYQNFCVFATELKLEQGTRSTWYMPPHSAPSSMGGDAAAPSQHIQIIKSISTGAASSPCGNLLPNGIYKIPSEKLKIPQQNIRSHREKGRKKGRKFSV